MLVLSRRSEQKIVFPKVGITVQVLRINGNIVKLGVDAPDDVRVFREEIVDPGMLEALAAEERQARHAQRNKLNSANLALSLLEKQLEKGMTEAADKTLQKVLVEFRKLEKDIVGEQPPTQAANLPRCRTLLVEDDTNESELLAGFLRLSGCDVAIANDGEAALDYLEHHERPDVVLLDMLMPRLDGRETIRKIRANDAYHGLKVYAVSGTSPAELGIVQGPRGVDNWFQKPLNPEKLVSEMRKALSLPC